MTPEAEWRQDVVAMIPALRAFAWSISRNGSDAVDLVPDPLSRAWSHRDKVRAGATHRGVRVTLLRIVSATAHVARRPDGEPPPRRPPADRAFPATAAACPSPAAGRLSIGHT